MEFPSPPGLDIFLRHGNVKRASELHSSLASAYVSGVGGQQDYDETIRQGQAAVDILADQSDSHEKSMANSGLALLYLRCLDLDQAEELR